MTAHYSQKKNQTKFVIKEKGIEKQKIDKLPRTESPRFSPPSLQEQQKTYPSIAPAPRKTVIASSIHPRSKRAGFSASDYKTGLVLLKLITNSRKLEVSY